MKQNFLIVLALLFALMTYAGNSNFNAELLLTHKTSVYMEDLKTTNILNTQHDIADKEFTR